MFFGVLAFLVLAFFVLSTPTVNSLFSCLSEYNFKMGNNIAIAREERWNKEKVCTAGKPALVEFLSCYSSVGSKSLFPVDLVSQITRMIKPGTIGGDVNEAIKIHNSSCIDYPEAQIL
ncbi:MAG: hypothetical protein A2905_04850 [Candidatus Levybacteria bacterium RIFCSPLOWO2_01_FULL_36_10]|nr:MAG: hypothetical protein A2905_04850 [Candidatus Levybacteria bacterium RIFCSPLOWO2_01_FULL_36_10]